MLTSAAEPTPTQPRKTISSPQQPLSPKPNRTLKILIPLILLALLVLGLAFGWFYFYGPCGVQPVKEAMYLLEQTLEKFDDANALASSTSRINLAGPIGDLQSIKRETDALVVPTCLGKSKTLLVKGMQSNIDAFLAFSSQESDTQVSSLLSNAKQQFALAIQEMKTINACAPFCQSDPYDAAP
jgi:hypothetical protein